MGNLGQSQFMFPTLDLQPGSALGSFQLLPSDPGGGSVGKESACSARALGSIPGSGRSPGEGNDNPLQYPCLENPMDRGAWQATYSSWGCKESDMTEATSPSLFSLFCRCQLLSSSPEYHAKARGSLRSSYSLTCLKKFFLSGLTLKTN